jgi:lipopolysaccharide/colanic/teichoic acid biosynthesis glycosyltransferase
MIKRFLDIALSSIGLVAVTPIIAAAGLAIWWQSPGPVFFRGLRAGLRGREFRIWKLRTMAVGRTHAGRSPGEKIRESFRWAGF